MSAPDVWPASRTRDTTEETRLSSVAARPAPRRLAFPSGINETFICQSAYEALREPGDVTPSEPHVHSETPADGCRRF